MLKLKNSVNNVTYVSKKCKIQKKKGILRNYNAKGLSIDTPQPFKTFFLDI